MSRKLQLPDPFAAIPRVNLLYPFPSPIHPLQSLTNSSSRNAVGVRGGKSTATGTEKVGISLYAKREDHSSPLACAGNKYRKLEYIIPDILSRQPKYGAGVAADLPVELPGIAAAGKDTVSKDGARGPVTTLVTEGAIQSNHTVQVASVASKIGLESVVLLHKGTGGGLSSAADKDAFLRTGNVQIVKLLGSDVRIMEPLPEGSTKTQDDLVAEVLEDLRKEGKVPYWIPSGASLHPLGGLGYARCAFEIARQEKEVLSSSEQTSIEGQEPRFDYIFVACGSGSTVGGLIAGFKLLDKMQANNEQRRRQRRIIGILTSRTNRKSYHEGRILRFAQRAGEMIGLEQGDITMDDVHLDGRFVGERYGVLDEKTKEMLAYMAQQEEVMLDPVYTAKVARGMMGWVDEGEIEREVLDTDQGQEQEQRQVNALFIHTGGQSALGAYADA
ncbi:tryptophan synthase beta subunit-like PLP-dependent enzyme [Aspergillus unguis]